ncbi:LacI family DNA-binding transcriptional regulator [Alkalispirochaeta alkalica]|nr:LacI family DNA-binding transcriptional regulator [Alkalispirochaeta alkalica]
MKDVAQVAGVSIGTVDRVLHKRGRVAPETASRVLEAARSLDFAPNRAASNLSRATPRVFVGLLPFPNQDSGYWRWVVRGIQKAAAELAHHYVEVEFIYYDRFSSDSFLRATAGLVHQEPGGIILAPTIEGASRKLVEELKPRPVVIIDGTLPGAPVLTTISADSLESGYIAGKLLDILCEKKTFLTVTPGMSSHHLQLRRQGFENYFSTTTPGKKTRQARLDHLNLASDDQWKLLPHWLEERRDVAGIFVTNSASHKIVSLLPRGFTPRIIGYDLIAENVQCLIDGSVDFIMNQHPENQGYKAFYALYRSTVLNEPVPVADRIPIDLMMRENLPFHPEYSGTTGETP